jgi:maltooligosyltrehalose trehalohydrolase
MRAGKLTSAARLRAMTALLLLGPQVPMLFMGQEFGASTPFKFFADHKPELAAAVHEGRREFMRQFAPYARAASQDALHDPASDEAFIGSKLDFSERKSHAAVYALHRDLLQLRRRDPVLERPRRESFDGATLSEHALILRWLDAEHGDRLLLVNLGPQFDFRPAPEPLLAPPAGLAWKLVWSSDDPRYEGLGVLNPCTETGWCVPAEAAALFVAEGSSGSARSSMIRTGG